MCFSLNSKRMEDYRGDKTAVNCSFCRSLQKFSKRHFSYEGFDENSFLTHLFIPVLFNRRFLDVSICCGT